MKLQSLVLFFLVRVISLTCQEKVVTIDVIKKYQKIELTKSMVLSLSSDIYHGRNILDTTIEKTQSYLENVMKSQKLQPFGKSFRHSFQINDSSTGVNIIGIHKGDKSSNTAVLVLANYDNIGELWSAQQTRVLYPGANDNASGMVAVIQMAIFYGRYNVKQNVVFAFTAGKRFSMCGASALGSLLEKNKIQISQTINLEMIGKPAKWLKESLKIKSTDSLAAIKLKALYNAYLGKPFFGKYEDSDSFLFEYSEHYPLYTILKVPSYTITSFDIDHDTAYMTPADNNTAIDIPYLNTVINSITYCIYKQIQEKKIDKLPKQR